MRKKCIVIFHVDDCCTFSKDKETIDSLLKNISNTFRFTDEGGVKLYIIINVIKNPNRTITMS